MKKIFILIICVLALAITARLDATPSIHGSSGFVTMPGTGTVNPGSIYLGGHFIGGEPSIPVNFGFGLSEVWELTGAIELVDNDPADPYLDVSTKYRYYNGSELHSAFGVSLNLAFDETGGEDKAKFSIYNVIGRYAFGGSFGVGFGYTFGNDDYINYWMGYSLEILSKVLYLETDLSNFSYRFPWFMADYQNTSRGIGNIDLRLHLGEMVILDFGILDGMDANRQGYIGGNVKLSL
ncbi:MAG: hypothetical protein KKH98_03830 [Spirochaetes bacterium]|nr:hypothetical protein [Spirochaetota bacterium]